MASYRNLALGALGGGGGGPVGEEAVVLDTSEQVYISSLALLKILKHGRAGVPLEVIYVERTGPDSFQVVSLLLLRALNSKKVWNQSVS